MVWLEPAHLGKLANVTNEDLCSSSGEPLVKALTSTPVGTHVCAVNQRQKNNKRVGRNARGNIPPTWRPGAAVGAAS